jgi:hypothetical protein
MNAPNPPNDAQRDLEQRALRNVRGLVDKIETLEESDSRAQRRMLLWIAGGALALVVAIVGYAWYRGHTDGGKPVIIDPAKLPPIQPGPRPPVTAK